MTDRTRRAPSANRVPRLSGRDGPGIFAPEVAAVHRHPQGAMIVGLGIDLVRTERVRAVLQRKGQRARERLFSAAEAARCDQSRHPPESYAARFAAKEA